MPSKRASSAAQDSRVLAPGQPPRDPHLSKILACEERLEEAVRFLAQALGEHTRKGKKPVLLHSLRVAFRLLAMGFASDVVIAGLLHDILEKTDLTAAAVGRRFGPNVRAIVAATTNNSRIYDALARYRDSVKRCAALGEPALVVRAADLIDNCDRSAVLGDGPRLEKIAEKLRLLIRVCRESQVNRRITDELVRRSRGLNRKKPRLALVSGGKNGRRSR